jgi:S1-C subfamily serine protease
MKNLFTGRRWLAAVSVATVLALTSFIAVTAATTGHLPFTGPRPTVKVVSRSEAAAGRGYSSVVKRVIPAVVNISSSKVTTNEVMNGSQNLDPFFRQFFGEDFGRRFNVPKERREKALGSGVIISPEGYILTNNHVVDHATDVTVTLHDKREMKARVVGADPRTDIAVLKIEGSNFPRLRISSRLTLRLIPEIRAALLPTMKDTSSASIPRFSRVTPAGIKESALLFRSIWPATSWTRSSNTARWSEPISAFFHRT